MTFLRKIVSRIDDFLDRYILPWPVRFLTSRFVILITIGLLIPLIVWAHNTVMVLAVNSYLNTMSVAVSSIVLLYATISEIRQKQIAEMQEKRAMEDHQHMVDSHNLILRTLRNQDIEMAELKQVLSVIIGQDITVLAPNEVPDLKSMHPLGNERFENKKVTDRIEAALQQNNLLDEIHKDYESSGDEY